MKLKIASNRINEDNTIHIKNNIETEIKFICLKQKCGIQRSKTYCSMVNQSAWQPSLIKHASENDVIILFKSNKNRN